MARRKKKSQEDIGSLDSLLDTMTNVVGILVILLAVTQIGVGDAIKRIKGFEDFGANISPEEIESKQAEVDELQKLVAKLSEQWAGLDGQTRPDLAAQVEIKKLIEDLKKQLKEKPDKTVDTAAIQKQIDERKKQAEAMEKQILAAQNEVAKLKAALDSTPERESPAPQVVTLPNPRPAPEGAKPLNYICREGRIIPVDVDRFQEIAEQNMRRINPEVNDKGEIDCDAVVSFFQQHTLGDRNFALRIKIHNHRPYIVFERKVNVKGEVMAGETTEQMLNRNSEYQRTIRRANPNKQYVRFLVWPDSFDTYLAAREIASENDLLAGWEPQGSSNEWAERMNGNLVCIGMPPPPPPKPNQAATAQPDTPPKPPLPYDTVD
ncbi:MAG: hypothetical protein GC159_20785 [Phycisphaera sp.]|nr:hypothetical protein [Phycisphaera sp.]